MSLSGILPLSVTELFPPLWGGIDCTVVAVTVADDDDILSLDSEVDVDDLCLETDRVLAGDAFEKPTENMGFWNKKLEYVLYSAVVDRGNSLIQSVIFVEVPFIYMQLHLVLPCIYAGSI